MCKGYYGGCEGDAAPPAPLTLGFAGISDLLGYVLGDSLGYLLGFAKRCSDLLGFSGICRDVC